MVRPQPKAIFDQLDDPSFNKDYKIRLLADAEEDLRDYIQYNQRVRDTAIAEATAIFDRPKRDAYRHIKLLQDKAAEFTKPPLLHKLQEQQQSKKTRTQTASAEATQLINDDGGDHQEDTPRSTTTVSHTEPAEKAWLQPGWMSEQATQATAPTATATQTIECTMGKQSLNAEALSNNLGQKEAPSASLTEPATDVQVATASAEAPSTQHCQTEATAPATQTIPATLSQPQQEQPSIPHQEPCQAARDTNHLQDQEESEQEMIPDRNSPTRTDDCIDLSDDKDDDNSAPLPRQPEESSDSGAIPKNGHQAA